MALETRCYHPIIAMMILFCLHFSLPQFPDYRAAYSSSRQGGVHDHGQEHNWSLRNLNSQRGLFSAERDLPAPHRELFSPQRDMFSPEREVQPAQAARHLPLLSEEAQRWRTDFSRESWSSERDFPLYREDHQPPQGRQMMLLEDRDRGLHIQGYQHMGRRMAEPLEGYNSPRWVVCSCIYMFTYLIYPW